MKISGAGNDGLVLTLGKREKQLLLSVLGQYAVLQARTQPLTRGGGIPNEEAAEKLLAESTAEQRADNVKKLEALLQSAADPLEGSQPEAASDPKASDSKAKRGPGGWRLVLSLDNTEWLLQILNEIRVGAWLKLGCPENRIPKLSATTAKEIWTMEVCGYFQSQLLEALANP